MNVVQSPEPWLRGTFGQVAALPRGVLHALELAKEDIERWCGGLSDEQLNARPAGIAPVAFHIRHIARSIDRLLTYAEASRLTGNQVSSLDTELDPNATRSELFSELATAFETGARRICALDTGLFEESRKVGPKQLPTTVGGLLVHIADHTQRHVGQAITTARVLLAKS
jgi:hypothetical protein